MSQNNTKVGELETQTNQTNISSINIADNSKPIKKACNKKLWIILSVVAAVVIAAVVIVVVIVIKNKNKKDKKITDPKVDPTTNPVTENPSTQNPEPNPTPTNSPQPNPTPNPTPTNSPQPTPTPNPTPTNSPQPTPTPNPTPTNSPQPNPTPNPVTTIPAGAVPLTTEFAINTNQGDLKRIKVVQTSHDQSKFNDKQILLERQIMTYLYYQKKMLKERINFIIAKCTQVLFRLLKNVIILGMINVNPKN